jgi:transcriptional regulator with XRE-family HTH domain
LATNLRFSRGQVGNYEQGTREPDQETLLKIASFFEVSTDYLLGLTDIKSHDNKEITIALNSDVDYDDLPPEAKDEIYNFIDYVRNKYKDKK